MDPVSVVVLRVQIETFFSHTAHSEILVLHISLTMNRYTKIGIFMDATVHAPVDHMKLSAPAPWKKKKIVAVAVVVCRASLEKITPVLHPLIENAETFY